MYLQYFSLDHGLVILSGSIGWVFIFMQMTACYPLIGQEYSWCSF